MKWQGVETARCKWSCSAIAQIAYLVSAIFYLNAKDRRDLNLLKSSSSLIPRYFLLVSSLLSSSDLILLFLTFFDFSRRNWVYAGQLLKLKNSSPHMHECRYQNVIIVFLLKKIMEKFKFVIFRYLSITSYRTIIRKNPINKFLWLLFIILTRWRKTINLLRKRR